MSLTASKRRVTETMQARLIATRTMAATTGSPSLGRRQLGRAGANKPRANLRRGDADDCLAARLDERLQSRIGETEGLEHEANDEDHRERGNHNGERDPPGTENLCESG